MLFGTLTSGSYIEELTKDKRERVGRLLQMHANSRQEMTLFTQAISLLRS